MCYAKPGPRCASHLRTEIHQAETIIAQYEKTYNTDSSRQFVYAPEYEEAKNKIADLRFSLAGTRAGQKDLDERINATKPSPKRSALVNLKELAKMSYDEKLNEYKKITKEQRAREAAQKAEKARVAAEKAAREAKEEKEQNRKAAALRILEQDSRNSIDIKKKKL